MLTSSHSLIKHKAVSQLTVDRGTFGTIKRMSGGGRFLTRGLRKVKTEAALSVLAFNVLHAANIFGAANLIAVG
jgi:hypothetical protein